VRRWGTPGVFCVSADSKGTYGAISVSVAFKEVSFAQLTGRARKWRVLFGVALE
jgi:hypothetical protein